MHSTEVFVKTLRVYRVYIVVRGTMKQLSFIISSWIALVHFLFSHQVGLVKTRILNSLDFLNIDSSTSWLNFPYNVLVLRGAWGELYQVYGHVRLRHWIPMLWKSYSWNAVKKNGLQWRNYRLWAFSGFAFSMRPKYIIPSLIYPSQQSNLASWVKVDSNEYWRTRKPCLRTIIIVVHCSSALVCLHSLTNDN